MDGQRSWASVPGMVIATTGPLVAAGVGWAAEMPGWAPAALAAAGAGALLLRDFRQGRPWSEVAFRAASGLGAGVWTAWSTLTGPWHVANLLAGAGAAFAGFALAPAFVGEDAPTPETPSTAAVAQPEGPTGRRAEWKARIEKQARVQPIKVLSDEDWPNGAGFTLCIAFQPESGDGWDSVDSAKFRIARAAHLPKGCVIAVEEGDLQGTAVLRIPTVYAMAQDLTLPEDLTPSSVWRDHPIGACEDTTAADINLRQAAALIVAMRGAGKSNLQKVIISQLLRCVDTLVWVVDLNGGGLAVPFMLPYAKGEVDTPPIDWVAASVDEAVAMAQVAAAIVKDRKSRYAALTAQSGGDLLPVTKDLPQITILVDEGAEVENNPAARKAMEALQEVLRIGRADAVNVVFSGLRGTQDMMPVPVRKQTTLKVCGLVEDDTELEYVLPGSRVRSADLVHPGTMFMRRSDRGKAVRQIKVYRGTPDQFGRIAVGTAHLRPTLDLAGQQVGRRVYAERMQRLRPWLEALAGKPVDISAAAPVAPAGGGVHRATATAPAPAPVEVQTEVPLSREERDEQRRKAREGLRRMAARSEVTAMSKDHLDDVFGALVADLRPSPAEQDGEGWRPELLIDLAREAGAEGIGPTEMRRVLESRGVTVSMKTINKWLPKYVEEGKLRKLDGGKYTV